MIKVRFAPSPTGYLHIGGARTALYNYLFAVQNNGTYVVRIEDTDRERSTSESEKQILESLSWLGLESMEKPVRQSENKKKYLEYAEKLVSEGKAYYCSCSKEDLDKRSAEKNFNFYDGKCRDLNIEKNEKSNQVIRLKNDFKKDIVFADMIRGEIKVISNEIDDFIIIRSDGFPTYNFSVVVDDFLMDITHVLRGDDHIANTPKQMLIYEALGFKIPEFGHFPMILGNDKSRLSKRHGAVSVLAYKEDGYLPEAVNNYLAKLGWGYKDQEIFTREELINLFDIKKISKSSAVFNPEKMLWVNKEQLQSKSSQYILNLLKNFWINLGAEISEFNDDYLIKIIELSLSRASSLKELAENTLFYFMKPEKYNEFSIKKVFKKDDAFRVLKEIKEILENINDFSETNLESEIRKYSEESETKLGKIAQPLRVALTGTHVSPGIFEVLELLGKEKSLRYIDSFLTEYN